MSIERQLAATLAAQPETIGQIYLTAGDFADFRAGVIFDCIRGLVQKQKTPDAVMVGEMLGDDYWQDVLDVFAYQDIPANVDLMQERIKGEARKRSLKRVASQFMSDLDVNSLLSQVEKIEGDSTNIVRDSASIVGDFVSDVELLASGQKKPGIQTGFIDLDDLCGGLVPGDSIVVAARTSVGKTAFMCNLVMNCGVPSGVVSGEQTDKALMRRMVAKVGGISMHNLKTGKLNQGEWERLRKAQETIRQTPLHIVDKARPSILEVEQYARTMHWNHGIKILFVDYLQLISNSAYPNDRRLQVADISARLKKLARDLNIPVVTLAQLNRGAVDHTPRISDLKESGAIEEDADLIMLLYREDDRPDYEVTVDVQKNREGATGITHLLWKKNRMTFENLGSASEF